MAAVVDELVATAVTQKRLDIQGLRGIAVLAVLANHAGLPLPGGFVGVDMFFVVSGFVITSSVLRRIDDDNDFSVAEFLRRRFIRLFPPLGVVVTTTCVVSILIAPVFGEQRQISHTAIGSLFGFANLVIAQTTGGYFDAPALSNPLLHLWSLGVEEQFYLGFALLIAFAMKVPEHRRVQNRLLIISLFGLGISLLVTLTVSSPTFSAPIPQWTVGFYSPALRAWELFVGVAVALVTRIRPTKALRSLRQSSLLTSSALLLVSMVVISESTPYPSLWTVIPVAATGVIIWVGACENSNVSRVLQCKPLSVVGDASYSVYLWHWPFVSFGHMMFPSSEYMPAAMTVVSILPATLSYSYIERPNQSDNRTSVWPARRVVIASTVVPLLFAAALMIGASREWWLDWPATSSKNDKVALANGCIDAVFSEQNCSWSTSTDEQSGAVLLVGDSHAYSIADGVIEAASRLGRRVIVSALSACPYSALVSTGDHVLPCESWQQEMTQIAMRPDIRVVLIANRSSGYTRPELGWRVMKDSIGQPANVENAAELYGEGLEIAVRRLTSAGKAVVLVNSLAEPSSVERRDSLLRRFMDLPPYVFELRTADEVRVVASQIENEIARRTGASVVDPMSALCIRETCPFWDDTGDIYLDVVHLSRHGSLLLAERLSTVIGSLLRDSRSLNP